MDIENIQKFLFKPVYIKNDDSPKQIYIIYNVESIKSRSLTPDGEISDKKTLVVDIVDVDNSIESGDVVTQSFNIEDEKKAKESIKIIDDPKIEEKLAMLNMLIGDQLNDIISRFQTCNKIFSCIRKCSEQTTKKEGNLLIDSESGHLIHLVFNTINGNTANLKNDDIKKIGKAIMDIIIEHLHIDLNDEKEVNDVLGKIEWEIIESLPKEIKAGDLKINREAIVEEIKAMQNIEMESDDDDTEEDDEYRIVDLDNEDDENLKEKEDKNESD